MLKFIAEYKSWLAFTIGVNFILNCIWLFDDGLANVSIIYMDLIYYGLLCVFIIVRYQIDKHTLQNIDDVELTPLKNEIAIYYKKQLEEASRQFQTLKWQIAESNDQLLAWVHDIKSPLTAMRLMLDAMPSSEDKRKLEAEWLRMYLLLDQQLHITRLQTIEQDSRFQKVELKKIVVQEVKALQSWCMEKGIGVELMNIECFVKTDAKWLAFIIRQYLTNAIKYSEPNSEIVICVSHTEQGHLLLKIDDSGSGIATHDLPGVFKKSYTGTKGRESSSASGMGLYLAKQAAHAIGLKLYLQPRTKGISAVIQFPNENEYTNQLGM